MDSQSEKYLNTISSELGAIDELSRRLGSYAELFYLNFIILNLWKDYIRNIKKIEIEFDRKDYVFQIQQVLINLLNRFPLPITFDPKTEIDFSILSRFKIPNSKQKIEVCRKLENLKPELKHKIYRQSLYLSVLSITMEIPKLKKALPNLYNQLLLQRLALSIKNEFLDINFLFHLPTEIKSILLNYKSIPIPNIDFENLGEKIILVNPGMTIENAHISIFHKILSYEKTKNPKFLNSAKSELDKLKDWINNSDSFLPLPQTHIFSVANGFNLSSTHYMLAAKNPDFDEGGSWHYKFNNDPFERTFVIYKHLWTSFQDENLKIPNDINEKQLISKLNEIINPVDQGLVELINKGLEKETAKLNLPNFINSKIAILLYLYGVHHFKTEYLESISTELETDLEFPLLLLEIYLGHLLFKNVNKNANKH